MLFKIACRVPTVGQYTPHACTVSANHVQFRSCKAQTAIVRFVVDLLYNKLYSKSTTECATNPQQIEQVEFELKFADETNVTSVVQLLHHLQAACTDICHSPSFCKCHIA
jgi:hypothetical protein